MFGGGLTSRSSGTLSSSPFGIKSRAPGRASLPRACGAVRHAPMSSGGVAASPVRAQSPLWPTYLASWRIFVHGCRLASRYSYRSVGLTSLHLWRECYVANPAANLGLLCVFAVCRRRGALVAGQSDGALPPRAAVARIVERRNRGRCCLADVSALRWRRL